MLLKLHATIAWHYYIEIRLLLELVGWEYESGRLIRRASVEGVAEGEGSSVASSDVLFAALSAVLA